MGWTTEESEFDFPQIQVCGPTVGPTHLLIQWAPEAIFFSEGKEPAVKLATPVKTVVQVNDFVKQYCLSDVCHNGRCLIGQRGIFTFYLVNKQITVFIFVSIASKVPVCLSEHNCLNDLCFSFLAEKWPKACRAPTKLNPKLVYLLTVHNQY
jgi:hypothetical protein